MPYSYEQGRYIHEFEELPKFEVERNLLTFATSRTGKGATQIIPWLLENTDTNALVIDPKGEALEATLQTRQSHRAVYALDPFNTTNNTQSAKATLNVLDFINPKSNSAFREINALADGLVMVDDPKAAHWTGGGVEILAGFIAHVISHPDFENKRSLVTVRRILTAQVDEFNKIVDDMAVNDACGNLPAVAASKLNNSGNEANHFISVAVSNTKWLDDPDIAQCLSTSSFDLREIKTKSIDVFLILPVEALGDYGRFLRLFVRLALYYMQVKVSDGQSLALRDKEVYFILDEAFSLGFISEIENSMSAMPGFGLRMWTFWQDYNQIIKRYDAKGAGTFFANSDVAYFFGVNDPDTAGYVSRATGAITEQDIGVKSPIKPKNEFEEKSLFDRVTLNETKRQKLYRQATHRPVQNSSVLGNDIERHETAQAELRQLEQNEQSVYQDELNEYQHARNSIGRPRISPEQVQFITKRNPIRKISDTALTIREGQVFKKSLHAYFEETAQENIVKNEHATIGVAEEIEELTTNQLDNSLLKAQYQQQIDILFEKFQEDTFIADIKILLVISALCGVVIGSYTDIFIGIICFGIILKVLDYLTDKHQKSVEENITNQMIVLEKKINELSTKVVG